VFVTSKQTAKDIPIALFTRNFAAMEHFYTQTLGFPVIRRWDDVTIIFIAVGSTTIELIGRANAPAPNSEPGSFNHLALQVEDVDTAYEALVAKGVKIKSAPANFKELRICFFFDPDGNSLELVEDPRKEGK
jgi:catechol 2,3-dioxygenase-like lactoylglutathione lyase family enzyme